MIEPEYAPQELLDQLPIGAQIVAELEVNTFSHNIEEVLKLIQQSKYKDLNKSLNKLGIFYQGPNELNIKFQMVFVEMRGNYNAIWFY